MKQAFLKFTGKKFITAAFLAASILTAPFAGHAALNHSNIEILSGENTDVQLAANTVDALFFKVHINNENGNNFILTIKNDNGDVLFSKSFNDTDFQKQFKLLKGDTDNGRYYFTVTSNDKNLEETYVISTTLRTVNDVEISKL